MTNRAECVLIEDRLPRLLENDLPAGETLLVRAHLADCEECAAASAEYEAIARSVAASRPSPELVSAALARVHAALGERAAKRPRAPRRIAAAVAVAGLAATGFFLGPPPGVSFATFRELPRTLARGVEPLARSFDLPAFLVPHRDEREGSGR